MKHGRSGWLRWGLGGTAALLLCLGAVSCRWGWFVQREGPAYVEYNASIVRGAVHLAHVDRRPIASRLSRLPRPGWHSELADCFGTPLVEWAPAYRTAAGPAPGWSLRLPLWIPFVLAGGAAGWMWWRHARRPLHACVSCGYDLRGVRDAVCPECGKPYTAPAGP